jgi:lipopolysaccharide transport system ATP-binding protein
MSDISIRAEGLSKRYQIGGRQEAYKTLRETIMTTVTAPVRRAGKLLHGQAANADMLSETIWALKDVSFEIKQGEAVGIIGRNGAGKSTLLKVLSRITEPTEGYADIFGRVGSLLEVGTGFHHELTGRENIFLNGAILGMRQAEIKRKLDEIVAFAEMEKFIDTPVKHYSTGMYMRLAFAVAAYLEPEILVVDEVLAVGDAAFQKKCLGKMGEVAKAGRTVLFVSHNMQAVSQLTNRCLLLAGGRCQMVGPTNQVINAYVASQSGGLNELASYEAPAGTRGNHLARVQVLTSDEYGIQRWGQPIAFEFTLRVPEPQDTLCFSFQVLNELQQPVCHFWLFDAGVPYRQRPGTFRLRCELPKLRLYMGRYRLTTYLSERRGNTMLESLSGIAQFEVTMQGVHREEYDWQPGTAVYLEDNSWFPVEEEPPAEPLSLSTVGSAASDNENLA